MTRPIASPALAHLRVLDLTRVRAGPTCCRILADFGADVIKIEAPPGVDPNEGISGARHGYDMVNLHRNKRSISINLKEDDGRTVFIQMLKTADVVVENYRPDVKDRLGIGYEALKAVNPRIILASISGFGQTGPYKTRAGFDQIAQGMGGLMGVTGEPGTPPMRAGIAVADSSAGVFAATGILIALVEREKSGLGQWVHTSLLQAQIAMMDFQAARYLIEGKVPPQAGNDHPTSIPTGVYPTKDGHINIATTGQAIWERFCNTIGATEFLTHPDYMKAKDRSTNRDALNAKLSKLMQQKTSAEWIARFNAAGVPCGPIYNIDEMFADPQVQHLAMAAEIDAGERGVQKVLRQPVSLSRTPSTIAAPTPDRGEHTDQVLREFGFNDEEIAGLRRDNAV